MTRLIAEDLRKRLWINDATILIAVDDKGTFMEAELAGVGICDPNNDTVDGLYIELSNSKFYDRVLFKQLEQGNGRFPVVALSVRKRTEPSEGLPVYERG